MFFFLSLTTLIFQLTGRLIVSNMNGRNDNGTFEGLYTFGGSWTQWTSYTTAGVKLKNSMNNILANYLIVMEIRLMIQYLKHLTKDPPIR